MNLISYQYEEYKRYLADLFFFIKDLYIFLSPYILYLAGHSHGEARNLSVGFK